MPQELIVSGVNWLDPRMIGLKCAFSNDPNFDSWYLGALHKVSIDNVSNYFFDQDGDYFKFCRLAQGDKTPYYGEGQPVPDGIEINVWFENSDHPEAGLSESFPWGEPVGNELLTHYQVKEQSKGVSDDKETA